MKVYRAAVVANQIWLVKNSVGVNCSDEGRIVLSRLISVSVVPLPWLVRLKPRIDC